MRTYLDGRPMDEFMFAAAVWMVSKRLAHGTVPPLDRTLCDDIDGQAGTGPDIPADPGTTPPRLVVLRASLEASGPGIATQPLELHAPR